MTGGYEHYRQHLQSLSMIEQHLNRIANCLEAQELRARKAEERAEDARQQRLDGMGVGSDGGDTRTDSDPY